MNKISSEYFVPKNKSTNLNYKNISLHTGLNSAKKYSDLVNKNLELSNRQNVILQTATLSYRNLSKNINRSKSQVNFKISKKKKSIIPQMESSIIGMFENKTQKIPNLKEAFQEEIYDKMKLQLEINKLKRLIISQKKLKSKISLKSCKNMNNSELIMHNRLKLQQQSRRYCIEIAEIKKQCQQLLKDEIEINEKKKLRQNEQNQTIEQNNKLEQQVYSLKVNLLDQEKKLTRIKQKQSIACKAMNNTFMVQNILKQQKAKLLIMIHDNVKQNS